MVVTGAAATEAELETLTNAYDVATFGIDVEAGGIKVGTQSTFSISDITEYAELTNLGASDVGVDIDLSSATNTAMTITAADLFAASDADTDLEIDILGTVGGNDTLNLSAAEGWSTADGGATYTTTYNNGTNDRTYTIDVENVNVTIIA